MKEQKQTWKNQRQDSENSPEAWKIEDFTDKQRNEEEQGGLGGRLKSALRAVKPEAS